jgi:hypothetical protein
MSYETKIDRMIGEHIAEFQAELTLARQLKRCLKSPSMPYGYPIAVYRPVHICKIPQVKDFITHTGGTLSNNVPRVLSMEMIGDYPVGLYNAEFTASNN